MMKQRILTILFSTGLLIFSFDKAFATIEFYLFAEGVDQRVACDYVEIKNNQIICTDKSLLITYDLSRIKSLVVMKDGKSFQVKRFTQEAITKINNTNRNKLTDKKVGKQSENSFWKSSIAQQLSFASLPGFAQWLKNKSQFGKSTLNMILLGSGFVIFLIGSIGYLIATFRVGILWGLSCMLLPFVSFIFLFVHWKVAAKPFFLSMLGVTIAFLGTLLVPAIGDVPHVAKPQRVLLAKKAKVDGRYKCSGKVYCSQMTSCAEAKFYLRNCPGTKMDGDNDGVPCEKQWCSH